MLSQEISDSVKKMFESRASVIDDSVKQRLRFCSPIQRMIIEFYYGTMPASDIGEVDFDLLERDSVFCLKLLEHPNWKVPLDIFFNYVAHYRVNNEGISDFRSLFYNELSAIVKGKTMQQAALAINLWCAQHVIYKSTDGRTASAITVLNSGYGRCGEESTFVVAAMRSAGIPARQVYTPRWAHCDDNHAWVEVWCDGEWRFLGACEPEPILDKGWFNDAAARAMLLHSRSFFPTDIDEEVVGTDGCVTYLNQTHRYAPCKKLVVEVLENGVPVSDVSVCFEIINMSELYPIAMTKSGVDGKTSITLGLGSVVVRAVNNGKFVESMVDTSTQDYLQLDLKDAIEREQEQTSSFIMYAPKDVGAGSKILTDEQKQIRLSELEQADAIRLQYTNQLVDKSLLLGEESDELIVKAQKNCIEVYRFINDCVGLKEDRIALLRTLSDKDMRDLSCDVLCNHFKNALKYKANFEYDVFMKYVACPRIHNETLHPYHEQIMSSPISKITCPHALWAYICDNFVNMPTNNITCSPASSLKSGLADLLAKKVLFVAVCRAKGIPARLDPINQIIQIHQDGDFVNIGEEIHTKKHLLTIKADENNNWVYMQNWTIARLEDGMYKTLRLYNCDIKSTFGLLCGDYRIITVNRMPNGNILANKYTFGLDADKTVNIQLHECDVEDMIGNIEFEPLEIERLVGNDISQSKPHCLIWLDVGREPSEHILNEIIEHATMINTLNLPLCFIVENEKSMENATFVKARESIEKFQVCRASFKDTVPAMGRRLFVDGEKLPFIVLTKGNCNSIYATSGYNVGTMDLIIKIAKALEQ